MTPQRVASFGQNTDNLDPEQTTVVSDSAVVMMSPRLTDPRPHVNQESIIQLTSKENSSQSSIMGNVVQVDLNTPAANAITLVPAQGQSDIQSGPSINQSHGSSSMQHASIALGIASSGASSIAPVSNGDMGFEAGDAGIRPMTLDPKAETTPAASGATPQAGSGGGNDPPADPKPTITLSGGGSMPVLDGSGKPTGDYTVPTPKAVGFKPVLLASVGDGLSITSYLWGGGTNYSSYTAKLAGSAADQSQYLGMVVDPTQSTYSFITDSTAETYTISLYCTYFNSQSNNSTLTFSTQRPNATLQRGNLGVQQAGAIGNGEFAVGMSGVTFLANDSTNANTAGAFMFLNIVNKTYIQSTNAAGQSTYQKNDTGAYNGPLHDYRTTAYPFYYSDDTNFTSKNAWFTNANSTMPDPTSQPPLSGNPTMTDAPGFQDTATDQKM